MFISVGQADVKVTQIISSASGDQKLAEVRLLRYYSHITSLQGIRLFKLYMDIRVFKFKSKKDI